MQNIFFCLFFYLFWNMTHVLDGFLILTLEWTSGQGKCVFVVWHRLPALWRLCWLRGFAVTVGNTFDGQRGREESWRKRREPSTAQTLMAWWWRGDRLKIKSHQPAVFDGWKSSLTSAETFTSLMCKSNVPETPCSPSCPVTRAVLPRIQCILLKCRIYKG